LTKFFIVPFSKNCNIINDVARQLLQWYPKLRVDIRSRLYGTTTKTLTVGYRASVIFRVVLRVNRCIYSANILMAHVMLAKFDLNRSSRSMSAQEKTNSMLVRVDPQCENSGLLKKIYASHSLEIDGACMDQPSQNQTSRRSVRHRP